MKSIGVHSDPAGLGRSGGKALVGLDLTLGQGQGSGTTWQVVAG